MALSSSIKIEAGVRQGGVLSPFLFSAFVDNVLDILESSACGCFINKRCVNSFLYADDLILLSPSVYDLQALFSLSSEAFLDLGLEINPSKTCCLRVGGRHMIPCCNIVVNGSSLQWVKETRYLGVVIKSSKHFSCNWFDARCNYFKALNNIIGSLGNNPPLEILLHLVKLSCFPLLNYGIAALSLSQKDIRSFTHAYNNVFNKAFKTFNADIIELCQYYCGCLPFSLYYDYLRFGFLSEKYKCLSLSSTDPFDISDYCDLYAICEKYQISPLDSKARVKFKIWLWLESTLFDHCNQ